MASILDSLPLDDYTRAAIAANDPRVRADLRAIPAAEAAGWRVSFRDGNWANSAQFERDGASVWQASAFWGPPRCGWRRSERRDGEYQPPGPDLLSLADALQMPQLAD